MRVRATVTAFFLLSGATALVYQVLWTRMVGLVIGHSALAVAAVVGSTMAGLGLGSELAGRRVAQVQRPLVAYGLLELAISAFALASPLLLGRPLLGALAGLGLPLPLLVLAAGFALLPATMAMGATLPLLTRWYARRAAQLGRDMGWLYAVNTTGAVLGAGFSGYLLLPSLGQPATLLLAAVGSSAVGLGAFFLGRRYPLLPVAENADGVGTDQGQEGGIPSQEQVARLEGKVLVAFAISGASALAMQVAWTRCFELVVGSTTYAFSGIVCSFIAGLAIGGHLFAQLVDRIPDRLALLAALNLGIALFAALLLPILGELPLWLIDPLAARADSFGATQGFLLLLVFGLLVLPTTFMGGTYPVATRILCPNPEAAGAAVGRAYAWNTGGAVVGAVGTGLVLIPTLGLRGTLVLALGGNLLAAAVLLGGRQRIAWALPLLALALALFSPPWDPRHMNLAPYMYAKDLALDPDLREAMSEQGTVVFHEEGRGATVSVIQRPEGARVLRINGKTDASTEADRLGQGMLGHLPMLRAQSPEEVLLIGLGSGMSLSAVLSHPANKVQVVELLPEVARGAAYFGPLLGEPLADPRVEVQVADGRQVLLSDQGPWDVIISQPTNLFISGIATLFTVEAFSAMREGLKDGGVASVWLQGYLLPEADFKALCRTFQRVFPEAELWNAGPFDYFLLGGRGPLALDRNTLGDRILATQESRVGSWTGLGAVDDLQRHFLMGPEALARYAGEGEVQHDRDPFLEFTAPRGLYGGVPRVDVPRLLSERSAIPLQPVILSEETKRVQQLEDLKRLERVLLSGQLQAIEAAGVSDPGHPVLKERLSYLLYDRALAAAQKGDFFEAESDCDRVLGLAPLSLPAWRLKSLLRLQAGDAEAAVQALIRARELQPWNAYAYRELASLLAELGREEEAMRVAKEALRLDPKVDAGRP